MPDVNFKRWILDGNDEDSLEILLDLNSRDGAGQAIAVSDIGGGERVFFSVSMARKLVDKLEEIIDRIEYQCTVRADEEE